MLKKIPNDIFFTFAEEELKTNGKIRFRVKGTSMYPLLRDGRDEVFLTPYDSGFLKRGYIVLFRYREGHILHSFIKEKGGFCFMKGINVIGVGEKCLKKDIIGVVEKVYREYKKDNKIDFKEINPYFIKWKFIISLWRLRCHLFRIILLIKKFCFQSK